MDGVGDTPAGRAAVKDPEIPLLRASLTLAAIAASIFLVSGAWCFELPSSVRPAKSADRLVLPAEWERTALTLRCEPSQDAVDRSTDRHGPTRRYALLVDWMLDRLAEPR
jgi:hypothetical protein